MSLSRKCQYALRALFELAIRFDQGPARSADIAKAQGVPPNFLELILKELRQAGWVESFRGVRGGYTLAIPPRKLSVGEVIRFIEGPLSPVKCMVDPKGHCDQQDRCAFAGLWDRVEQLVSGLYDSTTFQDLIEEQAAAGRGAANYNI